jgi:hypothetical protein
MRDFIHSPGKRTTSAEMLRVLVIVLFDLAGLCFLCSRGF